VPMLHGAGFETVDVRAGVDENTLVYVATHRCRYGLATPRPSSP
jgi:hypothetical protein